MNPDEIPAYKSKVQMNHIVRLEDCLKMKVNGGGGSIRLGPILKYMDICACLSAERLAKSSCVTLSMDHLILDEKISCSEGDLMIIESQVVRAFNTSAEVLSVVYKDWVGMLEKQCLAFAYFVFVRVDKGRMRQIFPQVSSEWQEYLMSMERRKARINKRKMMEKAVLNTSTRDAGTKNLITEMAETCSVSEVPIPLTATTGLCPADKSLVKHTLIVLPPHANHMGHTFGGQIMEWAEESALISAKKHVCHSATSDLQFMLTTVFVDGFTFFQPTSVGDRIVFRSQCTRAFGQILEVEVVAYALDVTADTKRHILTGHFSVVVRSSTGEAYPVENVLASTVEQSERYESALGRMLVAAVQLESLTGNLIPPTLIHNGDSLQMHPVSLTEMLDAHRQSIWTTCMPSMTSLSLSTRLVELDAEMAAQCALQDVSGLLIALQENNDSCGEWENVQDASSSTGADATLASQIVLKIKRSTHVLQLRATVKVDSSIDVVQTLVLDISRRQEWDTLFDMEHITSFAHNIDVMWMGTKGHPASRPADYALMRSHTVLSDGRIIIVSRSITCPYLPPRETHKRGEVLPSGFLLKPIERMPPPPPSHRNEENSISGPGIEGGTVIEYLLQIDQTSADFFVTELEGRTTWLRSTLGKLSQLLQSQRYPS